MSGASPGNAREHHSPMLFEELLESSPDAIIVTDLEGRITGANAQLEKRLSALTDFEEKPRPNGDGFKGIEVTTTQAHFVELCRD